jgi:hypothetical protein
VKVFVIFSMSVWRAHPREELCGYFGRVHCDLKDDMIAVIENLGGDLFPSSSAGVVSIQDSPQMQKITVGAHPSLDWS